MEGKVSSVRKYWSQSNKRCFDTTSLNIFDANGNTILQLGEATVPENDASILSFLLTSPRNQIFTAEVLQSNYICVINAAGHLIARGGFNAIEERQHYDRERIDGQRNDQRTKDHTSGENEVNEQKCAKGEQQGVDVIASGAVSGLVVVVNGRSCDRESISGILDDTIRLLKGKNAYPISSELLASDNDSQIMV